MSKEDVPANEEFRIAPNVLFKSFLVVAGAYVANIVLLFAIANVAFPDSMRIIMGEPEAFSKILAEDPTRVFPPSMFWVLVGSSVVSCFGLGYAVVAFAPTGKFSQAIFFATILFVQYLQLAIGADSALQTKLILLMAVSPVSALLGANWAFKRLES